MSGLALWSLFIPLQLVATILLTLLTSYGGALLVFHCIGLGTRLNWIPPLLCLPAVMGLGLDFGVLVAARVLEYRTRAYTAQGSILKTVYKIGRVLVAASLIISMTVSN